MSKKPQKAVTVYLKPEQIVWLDHKTEDGIFENRSHGVRTAIKKLMEEEV